MKNSLSPILAVGGLDPSGHAGILADGRVFEDLGRPYRVALSALTVQSERQFFSWKPVPLKIFRAQLEAAGKSLAGVKIGMLGDSAHLAELLRWLEGRRVRWLLWDPVWRSSTGGLLFKIRPRHPLLRELLRRSDVVTPNFQEAEWLLGHPIRSLNEAKAAAEELWKLGKKPRRAVVLKGGHLLDPSHRRQSIDCLAIGGHVRTIRAKRLPKEKRGSGCTFASALLAKLCSGRDPEAAAEFAKRYVLRRLWGKLDKEGGGL